MDPGLAWGFLAVGSILIGIAVWFAMRPIRLLRAGGRAQGVVTGNDREEILSRRGPMSNRWMFFPRITYTAAGGRKVSIRSRIAGSRPLPVGSAVPLLYDPAHPEQAEICSFVTLWGFPVAALVFGLPLFFQGLWGLGLVG